MSMNQSHRLSHVGIDMSAILDAGDDESSTCGYDESGEDDDNVSISSITPVTRRSKLSIALVLLLGLSGGIAFCVLTIRAEQAAQNEHFVTRATQLSKDITSTVQEYEVAARSVHNVCRNRKTTRQEFRQFYEYLTSGGLRFGAAQCVPNVTHAERPIYEAEASAFYKEHYPNTVNYTGFNGFNHSVDPATGETMIGRIPVADDAPFYFPVHYSEPVVRNAKALGLDTFSHPFQKMEIIRAIETHEPVLGGRMKVVQENDNNAYSVIIRSPGIRVAESENEDEEFLVTDYSNGGIPQELGVILVRIPSLLERRAEEQRESMGCFLYDVSPHNTGGDPVYLGSAQYIATVADGTINTTVTFPEEEVEYDFVKSKYPSNRLMEVTIPIADGSWKLIVTPMYTDDSFEVSVYETIFGTVMIMVGTLGVAVFLYRNMRQMQDIHKAKNQAEAERKIIASLYPENVVKRLLEDEEAKQQTLKEKAKNKGKVFDGKMPAGSGPSKNPVMIAADETGSSGEATPSISLYGSKPIADFFPETSIFFGDLVGFTAWSDQREPTQVFTLLEYIYNEFDLIARRRGVFKVETVGDCYVAVVGVPYAKKNHASVMCKFAKDCLMKMKSTTHELTHILGADTAALDLRVGINSGPVTGGVLRGEKGRFQLFGDSMNTAARMEHHGKAGKIHVSPSTAECLVKAGKERWLTRREDKIHAKGKGKMTTYWVQINAGSCGTGRSFFTTSTSGYSSNPDVSNSKGDLGCSSNHDLSRTSELDIFAEEEDEEDASAKFTQESRGLLSSFADMLGITDELEV